MVQIQVKYNSGENNGTQFEFLQHCQTSSTIQELTNSITEIANLQQQIHLLGIRLLPRISPLLRTHPHAVTLHRALSEANSYVSEDQVLQGKPLSNLVLRDQFRSLEKEFQRVCNELGFPESNLGQVLSDLALVAFHWRDRCRLEFHFMPNLREKKDYELLFEPFSYWHKYFN